MWSNEYTRKEEKTALRSTTVGHWARSLHRHLLGRHSTVDVGNSTSSAIWFAITDDVDTIAVSGEVVERYEQYWLRSALDTVKKEKYSGKTNNSSSSSMVECYFGFVFEPKYSKLQQNFPAVEYVLLSEYTVVQWMVLHRVPSRGIREYSDALPKNNALYWQSHPAGVQILICCICLLLCSNSVWCSLLVWGDHLDTFYFYRKLFWDVTTGVPSFKLQREAVCFTRVQWSHFNWKQWGVSENVGVRIG